MIIDAQYDLTAIGLPFADIVADVDDVFLKKFGFTKNTVASYPPAQLLAAHSELINYEIYAGGSQANTCAGIYALGGKAAFLGRASDDTFGRAFRKAFPPGNVYFPNQPYGDNPNAASGVVMVLRTGSATTIASWPGIGTSLTEADIFPAVIEDSKIFSVESYLLQLSSSRDIVAKAIDIAKAAKREVAFSLHDHRYDIETGKIFRKEYLPKGDMLIGNRKEFEQLFGSPDPKNMVDHHLLMIMTDGANGAYVMGRGENLHILPHLMKAPDNTIGAGDAFTAGFLFGYIHGLTLPDCGELGAETASTVLHISSARPASSWKSIAEKYLIKAPAIIRPTIKTIEPT